MQESRDLEFKQEITNTFLKTVSAYANFGAGTIIFGIDDNGTIIGIDNPDKASMDIENRINDSIKPKPDYSIDINRKTNVISLSVSEGKYKPYLYKGKAYRRSGTATIEADSIELKRLTLEGLNLYFEGSPCQEEHLEFKYLESKLIEKLGISKLTDDILRTFGFVTKDNHFNIAAELFADTNTYSGIDIARFGNTINEILDRETFSGISILKQYDMAVSAFKRYYQYDKIEGMLRKTIDIIPEEAFREAIANALIHRTWDINSHIRIAMFSDKIELTSPGGLPKGITKEEYINGYISNLRNPIIGNLFFRMHYIEMFGTGIRRIMAAYEGAPMLPVFDATENTVRVILPCLTASYQVTAESRKIIDLLEKRSVLSSNEIASALKWNKAKVIRVLNTLITSGNIQKIGAGRNTKYAKRR